MVDKVRKRIRLPCAGIEEFSALAGENLLGMVLMARKLLVLGDDSAALRRYSGRMGERRGRRMRGPRLLAAVVLVPLALGGCALVEDGQQVWGILQADAGAQAALSAAIDELRELPGVEGASSRFLSDGPRGDEADIEVAADTGSTSQELVAMAEVARKAFGSAELESSVSKFTVTVGDLSVFRTSSFRPSATVLAGEVAYWRAAEAAIGTELSVTLIGDGSAGQYREVIPAAEPGEDSAFTANFLAGGSDLLALEDEWTAPTMWVLPGMTATPGLPPVEVFALLEEVQAELPLSNPRTASEGAIMWWQGKDFGLTVVYTQNELRESDWPSAIALAQQVITAAIPGSGFVYQTQSTTDFTQHRFHLNECTTEVTAGPDDRALVDALAAAGTPVPATGGPGFCAPV